LLTLTDGTNTSSISFADTTPLTGQFFGLRDRPTAAGSSLDADFDNFAITAVPEPATAGMLAVGVHFLARRRRR
jgi:hypothetical protein